MKSNDVCNSEYPQKRSGILSQTFSRKKSQRYGRSPGPIYMLPGLVGKKKHDPRSMHYEGPAFSFGKRTTEMDKRCGPGPKYELAPRLLRTGWDKNAAYSMAGKNSEKIADHSPGPAAYLPKNAICKLIPGYTFGLKVDDKDAFCGPGPAAYSLGSLIGCKARTNKESAPCYTIRQKNYKDLLNTNPGPGTYKIVDPCLNQYCPPKYTIAARFPNASEKCQRPGPGRYCPEKVRAHLNEAPHFSFGIRWNENMSNNLNAIDDDVQVCKMKSLDKDICAMR